MVFENIIFLDDTNIDAGPNVRLHLDRDRALVTILSQRENEVWSSHAKLTLDIRDAVASIAMDVAAIRACSAEQTTADTLYAAIGNDYRGEFRAMAEASGDAGSEILGRIAYASLAKNPMHLRTCAWLDACTHAPMWWSDHQRRSSYVAAVGAYHMDSTDVSLNREVWGLMTVDKASGSGASRLCNSALACLVRVEGSRGGMFDASTLEERRTRRHLYQLQWKRGLHSN